MKTLTATATKDRKDLTTLIRSARSADLSSENCARWRIIGEMAELLEIDLSDSTSRRISKEKSSLKRNLTASDIRQFQNEGYARIGAKMEVR